MAKIITTATQERNKSNEHSTRLTGKWLSANDGWFSYYRCSNCGHKTMDTSTECPACKAAMILN